MIFIAKSVKVLIHYPYGFGPVPLSFPSSLSVDIFDFNSLNKDSFNEIYLFASDSNCLNGIDTSNFIVDMKDINENDNDNDDGDDSDDCNDNNDHNDCNKDGDRNKRDSSEQILSSMNIESADKKMKYLYNSTTSRPSAHLIDRKSVV